VSNHSPVDDSDMFEIDRQIVRIHDVFSDGDLILDLGGGGEGVIGQLRGRQVVAIDRRKDELEECAQGPLKVVADAKDLPFLDATFDAATAFFFLMYVPEADHDAVFSEAYRVLKPGALLHVWDVTIPPRGDRPQRLFVVPVTAELPDRAIETGYGTRWAERTQSADTVVRHAEAAGFVLIESTESSPETFRLAFRRAAS
jgi:ubiquinone/menaquinone biosynthesis C-methylase UbiE